MANESSDPKSEGALPADNSADRSRDETAIERAGLDAADVLKVRRHDERDEDGIRAIVRDEGVSITTKSGHAIVDPGDAHPVRVDCE